MLNLKFKQLNIKLKLIVLIFKLLVFPEEADDQ
jgi:hypothetical protein